MATPRDDIRLSGSDMKSFFNIYVVHHTDKCLIEIVVSE